MTAVKKERSAATLAKGPSTWSNTEGVSLVRPPAKSRSKIAVFETTEATAAVATPPSKRAKGNQAGGKTSTGAVGPAGPCVADDDLLKLGTVAKPPGVVSSVDKFLAAKTVGFKKLLGKGR